MHSESVHPGNADQRRNEQSAAPHNVSSLLHSSRRIVRNLEHAPTAVLLPLEAPNEKTVAGVLPCNKGIVPDDSFEEYLSIQIKSSRLRLQVDGEMTPEILTICGRHLSLLRDSLTEAATERPGEPATEKDPLSPKKSLALFLTKRLVARTAVPVSNQP
jgi:hypothetical protein